MRRFSGKLSGVDSCNLRCTNLKDLSIPSHIRLPHSENVTLSSLIWKTFRPGTVALALLLLAASTRAQNQPPQGQSQQDIPDAPSAIRPVQPFPATVPP